MQSVDAFYSIDPGQHAQESYANKLSYWFCQHSCLLCYRTSDIKKKAFHASNITAFCLLKL